MNLLQYLRLASFRRAISMNCLISRISLGWIQCQGMPNKLYRNAAYHGERGFDVSYLLDELLQLSG